MRFVCTSDWHIRASNPRIRSDNYYETQLSKVKQILNIADDYDASILIAGDIFDKPICPFSLINEYISLLNTFHRGIFVVAGQHDLHYHNPEIKNTPFGTLLASGVVELAEGRHGIYGCSWGEEIPEEGDVLLVHTPVTPGEPPFFMEGAVSAEDMVKELEGRFELVVSGDYHVCHTYSTENTILVNPGPIMRASKDQMGTKPSVYIVDLDRFTVEQEYLDIEDDVWDESALSSDENKELSEELKRLISETNGAIEFDKFWDIVDSVAYSIDAPEDVIDILKEIKEVVENEE